jgi:hypothetical protein
MSVSASTSWAFCEIVYWNMYNALGQWSTVFSLYTDYFNLSFLLLGNVTREMQLAAICM